VTFSTALDAPVTRRSSATASAIDAISSAP